MILMVVVVVVIVGVVDDGCDSRGDRLLMLTVAGVDSGSSVQW